MREIKFRAWDTEEKRMTIVPVLLFLIDGSHKIILDEKDHVWHPLLMQFTGLLDKNGEDIYEGDIVKEDFNQDGTHDSIGVIEFYEGSFGSRNSKDRFRIPALFTGPATEGMNLNYYEVIGNIYETPELLEA